MAGLDSCFNKKDNAALATQIALQVNLPMLGKHTHSSHTTPHYLS